MVKSTLLYGYGGLTFHKLRSLKSRTDWDAFWKGNGGVFAMANIRGSEYGKKWHEAGPNFKSKMSSMIFIAAAEFFDLEKYTSPESLASMVVQWRVVGFGAGMTQRPDLFKSCIPMVGGWICSWLSHIYNRLGMGDYGSSEDEANFKTFSPIPCITSERMWTILLHWSQPVIMTTVLFLPILSKFIFNPYRRNTKANPALIRIDVQCQSVGTNSLGFQQTYRETNRRTNRYLLIPHVQFRHDNAVILWTTEFEKSGCGWFLHRWD